MTLDLTILSALNDVKPNLLREPVLLADVRVRSARPIEKTEFTATLRQLGDKNQVLCLAREDGALWKIAPNGEARLAENGIL